MKEAFKEFGLFLARLVLVGTAVIVLMAAISFGFGLSREILRAFDGM